MGQGAGESNFYSGVSEWKIRGVKSTNPILGFDSGNIQGAGGSSEEDTVADILLANLHTTKIIWPTQLRS